MATTPTSNGYSYGIYDQNIAYRRSLEKGNEYFVGGKWDGNCPGFNDDWDRLSDPCSKAEMEAFVKERSKFPLTD